jgi:hypothetical protein
MPKTDDAPLGIDGALSKHPPQLSAFSSLAVLWFSCVLLGWLFRGDLGHLFDVAVIGGPIGFVLWLIGRACHYVLGGDVPLWERSLWKKVKATWEKANADARKRKKG